ncbi:MAG: hypothetical protein KGM16_16385, partial [Bacteroidota bacterium]|nr:hypothetical protein [Bacteroidota bacterium]
NHNGLLTYFTNGFCLRASPEKRAEQSEPVRPFGGFSLIFCFFCIKDKRKDKTCFRYADFFFNLTPTIPNSREG